MGSVQDVDVEGRFLFGIRIWVDGVVDADVRSALLGEAALIAERDPARARASWSGKSGSGGAGAGTHRGGSLPANTWLGRLERGQT